MNTSGSFEEAFLSSSRNGEHESNKSTQSNGGTHYLYGSSETNAGGSFEAPAASLNRRIILPLRSWINHALQSVPDSDKSRPFLSTSYLQSCLQVAISLADQILQAEKSVACGISNQLDVLSLDSSVDWTEHATVAVLSSCTSFNHTTEEDIDRELKLECEAMLQTFEDEFDDDEEVIRQYCNEVAIVDNGVTDRELNQKLEAIMLKTIDQDESNDIAETNHKCNHTGENEAVAAMGVGQNFNKQMEVATAVDWETVAMVGLRNDAAVTDVVHKDMNNEVEAFLEMFGVPNSQNTESKKKSDGSTRIVSDQTASAQSSIDYFNVDSAEVHCLNSNTNPSSGDAHREKLQRMYHLALMFYELFTGGQPPSSNLRALASLNGAFVSLPILALVRENNVDKADTSNQSKRRQCSEKNKGLCRLTFEYLQLMQIPGPLCHLIFNMLDCVHGELSGGECYDVMADIRSDLQLMLDKPKFLRGLELSTCGLQLNEISIPREEEIQSILSCYQRCISGACEFAIVSGSSGAGKSWILEKVRSVIIAEGGLFLMGKFDQRQQSKPFSALAVAFDQYVEVLLSQVGSNWANTVVNNLQTALGQDAYHLVEIIPRLGRLLDLCVYGSAPNNFNYDCGNATDRIHYLLCRFVEVIAITTQVSLTLCLDDVQWMDNASASVLSRVLAQTRNKFFFLGCCRDDELEPDHPYTNMIRDVNTSGVNTTTVMVTCMNKDEINNFVSELLCLSPRLVEPLAHIIYSRTKGNILFVSQLLLSLNRDGLLQIDLGSQRWMWDEQQICSTKLPDNVAICFTNGIAKLPTEVQLSIHTLSMFGASARSYYLAALESRLVVKILEPLQLAVKEGLVSCIKDSYTFCHDRIQEASYNMIAEHDRLCNHLTYGRCLMRVAIETGVDDALFVAINQINSGSASAITNPEEYVIMAGHNMNAGKRAMAQSNFHTAFTLFDNGISFLRKDHWKQHYTFSMELYELAARCALASGSLLQVTMLTDHILRRARSFEDQLNAHFIIMSLQERSPATLPDALEKGLAIVRQLGESIDSNPSQSFVEKQIEFTIAITRNISPDIFHNNRFLSDTKKLALMKFLERIQTISFFTNQTSTLTWCVVLKIIQVAVSCGVCPESCTAFALYACLLVRRGEITLASSFATLAKSLLGRFDSSKEGRGRVLFWVCETKCFLEPCQAANEDLLKAEAEALSAGDIHYACWNRMIYCTNIFWLGVALEKVKEKVTNACLFMKTHNHLSSLDFMMSVNSTLSILMEGDAASESRNNFIIGALGKKNARLQMQIATHSLYLDFVFYQQDLKGCCERFYQKEIPSSMNVFQGTFHSFISGLASYRLYRETEDIVWYERGKKRLDEFKLWVDRGAAWNFSHKLNLLEAEDSFCLGDFDSAKQSYKNAITASGAHKFNNDSSLSHELAAKFYLSIGELKPSLEHFTLAHEMYATWGAMGKAQKLFTYTNETFTRLIASRPNQTRLT